MIDEINEYVKENGVDASTRVELMTGDGWSVQLVGDGYFGVQPNDHRSTGACQEYSEGWWCSRTLGHPGPHIASAGFERGASVYISMW